MTILDNIRPTKKHLVFDLVESAGLDMTDWVASSNDKRGPKANPKYCYDWSFVQQKQVVILNLWHPGMALEAGDIVERGNFRADAKSHRGTGGKVKWFERAKKLDEALQEALRDNLPVRVIINDGIRRKPGDPNATKSVVFKRELDPEPWTIAEYDWKTGAHVLKRGIVTAQFVDQFDIQQSEKADAEKREQSGTVFVRDPRVRNLVKQRSNGRCEFCGEPGFEMASGAIYLETHHIVPLSEGGPDTIENVIALCPLDHRMAHYSHDHIKRRAELKKTLKKIILA